MTLFESIILGAVQGVTEFLPISSSGHLVIFEKLLGLNVESLKGFDVSLHIGTLLAILVYFWRDVWNMMKALFKIVMFQFDRRDEYMKLIAFIFIGTIPAVVVGGTIGGYIDEVFRGARAVGIVMIVASFLFFYAEYVAKKSKKEELTGLKALMIGLFQMIALIPGVSRSGATISGGLLGKMSREKAARFSFLLGIPVIAGAGLLTALKTAKTGMFETTELHHMIAGFSSSFLVGLFAVYFLMKYLKKHSLNVFAYYRIVVGVVVILFL